MRRTVEHPAVLSPLVITERPTGRPYDDMWEGVDLAHAVVVLAHQVKAGDLLLADFPDGTGPREAEHFEYLRVATPRQLTDYCGCPDCEANEEEDSIDAPARYVMVARDEEGNCEFWFRHEPVLIIPAAHIPPDC